MTGSVFIESILYSMAAISTRRNFRYMKWKRLQLKTARYFATRFKMIAYPFNALSPWRSKELCFVWTNLDLRCIRKFELQDSAFLIKWSLTKNVHGIGHKPLFEEKNESSLRKGYFMTSMVENGLVVLEKLKMQNVNDRNTNTCIYKHRRETNSDREFLWCLRFSS